MYACYAEFTPVECTHKEAGNLILLRVAHCNMSMNATFAQAISLSALIGIFVYVFIKYPLSTKKLQNMVYAALFVLLSVVLNAIAPMIPFFGVPSVKISLSLLPLMIGGALLPPSWAYLLGFVTDVVGLLITPTDFPFFGFTLNHVLAAVIPSLWYEKSASFNQNLIEKILFIVLFAISLIATVYIFDIQTVVISQEEFVLTNVMKIGIISFIWLVSIAMICIIYVMRKRMREELASEFTRWVVVALVIGILISAILTPTWLSAMYEKPWFVFAFLQIIKTCALIPIYIIVGFSVIKVVKQTIKL